MSEADQLILQRGRIPSWILAPYLSEFLERYETFGWNEDLDDIEPGDGIFTVMPVPPIGPQQLLAERIGTSPRQLNRIERAGCVSVTFDLADRLLIEIGRHDLWRGELHDYYYGVNLAAVDIEAPVVEEAIAA